MKLQTQHDMTGKTIKKVHESMLSPVDDPGFFIGVMAEGSKFELQARCNCKEKKEPSIYAYKLKD